MISSRQPPPRSVVLYCTMIVYLVGGLIAASFGAVQSSEGLVPLTAYGLGTLLTVYGLAKGARVLVRDIRRRSLIRGRNPLLYDMADYLGGHPDLPKSVRVLALLTADRLILDAPARRVEIPLTATRLALRADGGNGRPFLVAHNTFGPRPADALDVEFLDGSGTSRRLTLAQFRRTTPNDWSTALAAAVAGLFPLGPGGSASPVRLDEGAEPTVAPAPHL